MLHHRAMYIVSSRGTAAATATAATAATETKTGFHLHTG